MLDGLTAGRLGAELGRKERRIENSYAEILRQTVPFTEGIRETPKRAARAWAEMTSGYAVDVKALCKTFDSEGYDEMIAAVELPFVSLCEHHLLPFVGEAHVVYLPNEQTNRVIGLSKIPRIVDAFARRLQQQERLTMQIANALLENLAPKGVLVVVDAHHMCMSCRGVRSRGRMRTSFTGGVMREVAETRAEAFALVGPLK